MIDQQVFYIACWTGNIKTIRQYIAEGGDVNISNTHGKTALMRTVKSKRLDCVKELIKAGANIHAKDNSGYTALTRAFRGCFHDCAEALVQAGADIYEKTRYGDIAINHCTNIDVKEQLIKLSQKYSQTAIDSTGKPDTMIGFDVER